MAKIKIETELAPGQTLTATVQLDDDWLLIDGDDDEPPGEEAAQPAEPIKLAVRAGGNRE